MSTNYVDRDWVYGASLNDGVTSGGITLRIPFGAPVSDATIDAAVAAFLDVVNSEITIISSSKQREAVGVTDWSWSNV